ncbi:Outer membrane protein TolC [Maridesulfovibrio ferrireducens]|uniref:Outer membrane protein TolC n=1 Tax=Maridesulfovibrio ferrireducens TaxID=246191 RepID=A0A1G9EKM8_9BACT|nr:TolC family protein [Maridesulfovibrio ferrireducens]SDK76694.1 Outer membrane protein TolC [Maridesulfovibrio ferrireducens]
MKRNIFLLFTLIFLLAAATASFAQQLQGEGQLGEAKAPVSMEQATEQVPQAVSKEEETADLTLTLEECVNMGLKRNPTIIAARKQLMASESSVESQRGQFGAGMKLKYGYTHSGDQPRSGDMPTDYQDKWGLGINVSQPIFMGFELLSKFQKTKLQREQSDASLYNAELILIRNIQEAFLTLLQGRMEVKSNQDSVARLKSQLDVIQAFYQVGLRPRVDVLQAEVELATAEQDMLKASNSVASRVARLNTLLNLPLEKKVNYSGELTYLPFSMTLDQCIVKADKDRPDLRIAMKAIKISEEDVTISESSFYPKLTADFNYNSAGGDPSVSKNRYNYKNRSDSWDVGANVNWDFFNWGATYYDVQRASDNVDKIKAEYDNTRLEASYEIKDQLLSLKASADRIGVGRKSVEAGREGYRMAMARYQAQVSTNNEVLNAQSRLSASEAQLIEALADYQVALARLFVAMGTKNPSLTTN